MSFPFNLTKQRMEELVYAWDSIRKSLSIQEDSMNATQFLYLLKSLGITLTKQEIFILQQEFASRGNFLLEDLLHIGSISWTEEYIEEALLSSLQILCQKESETISLYDLRNILYKLGVGIRLTYEEIDSFLNQFPVTSDSCISIDSFVCRILQD
ncbi:uncharacterized protein LOC128882846 [Hylaeus volcanicus]|uniref:uncharacterized protein LOC128882846 n=1 Tax=Hylaeus volcanicus TaxID=313075 RepID=UPI0023B795E7|nr:uncharacterized protein LOC128882846 [Hylaeus volcanicus]